MAYSVTVERQAELQKLVPAWDELAAHAVEPNAFYEPWMLLPALEAFAGDNPVDVICVWQGERLDALLPFERLRRYRGFPVSTLALWRRRHAMLGTPLVRAEYAAAALARLIAWIDEHGCAALLELNYVPAGGAFQQALCDALNECRKPVLAFDGYTRGLLRRDRDAETYIATAMSAESRGKLRRVEKRLGEQGEVAHRVLKPGDDIGHWIDEFMKVEASGWKGQRGSALACTPANRQFGTEIFNAAHERGRLIMVGLDVDRRPIARYTAFTAGEGAFVFKTAYDEEFRRFSPGLLAELDMVRAFHARPELQWMDSFTSPGNSTIDRLWKHRWLVQRLVVGLTPWGQCALAALPVLQLGKRLVTRWRRRAASAVPEPRDGRKATLASA